MDVLDGCAKCGGFVPDGEGACVGGRFVHANGLVCADRLDPPNHMRARPKRVVRRDVKPSNVLIGAHTPMDVRPLVALDMATKAGWAVRKPDGTIESGQREFPRARGETEGAQFLRFRAFVRSLLVKVDAPGPKPVVAFERPHHRGGAATDLAAGFRAVLLEEAASYGLEVMTVASSTLKKHATGCGKAGCGKIKNATERRVAMKAAMKRAAARRWNLAREPESDDEADALCVLSWVLDQIGEA